MEQKELFNGTPITEIADDENLAVGKPSVAGSKVISWSAFKAFFASLYVGITGTQTVSGDKTFTGKLKANAPVDSDDVARLGDIPDVDGFMDKLVNPTNAQRLKLLKVDSTGQAITSQLSIIENNNDFTTFLLEGTNKTALLVSDIDVSGYYTVNGGEKRIIGEGTTINLTADTTFGHLADLTFIIEPTIYSNVDNIKWGDSPNNSTFRLYANYIKSENTANDFTFGKIGSGAGLLGDVRAFYSNADANIKNASVDPFTAVTLGSSYFVSNEVLQTTGVAINFIQQKIYNTSTSPATGNITFSQLGAKLGVVQKIYHNSGTAPTFSGVSGIQIVSQGLYAEGQLNIIFAEWVADNRVEYWIVQEG